MKIHGNKLNISFGSNYKFDVNKSNRSACDKSVSKLYNKENTDFKIYEEFSQNLKSDRIATVFVSADDKYDNFIESLLIQNKINFKKLTKDQSLQEENIISRIKMPGCFNSDEYSLVTLNTAKFDGYYKQDKDFYIGKNGKNGSKYSYESFQEYLKTGKDIEASRIHLAGENGKLKVSFYDGRHRYSVMRDLGLKSIKFAIASNQIPLAEKYGLLL